MPETDLPEAPPVSLESLGMMLQALHTENDMLAADVEFLTTLACVILAILGVLYLIELFGAHHG